MNVSDDPSIVISVYNDKKQVVETAREIRSPAMIAPAEAGHGGTIFWGHSWHMQTPLENLLPGSYLHIEYRPKGEAIISGQLAVAASSLTFVIDANAIDSMLQTFELQPTVEAGKQANPIHLHNERSYLLTDIVISRRSRSLDLKTILTNT